MTNFRNSLIGNDTGAFDQTALASAERFVRASCALDDRVFWPLRIFTNAQLFLWHIDAFAGPEQPVPAICKAFDAASSFLETAPAAGLFSTQFPPAPREGMAPSKVGEIFGDIYQPLSDKEYFEDAYEVLNLRLTKNDVDPRRLFAGKVVVDVGCGSGKYSAAMIKFGAAKVRGFDIAEKALETGRHQAQKSGMSDRIEYQIGSALDVPASDESADVVWANSVLHLVDDANLALKEISRVLKPGGTAFIYVNGRFGLFELLVRALYAANKGISRQLYQHYLALSGMRPGRVAWVVGTTFAPYRFIPKDELERLFKKNALTIERQLTRGLATDQMEQVNSGLAYGTIKYGESKLNYLVRKASK